MDDIERAILISRLRGEIRSREYDKLSFEFPEIEWLRVRLEIAHKYILKKENNPSVDTSNSGPSEGEPAAKAKGGNPT